MTSLLFQKHKRAKRRMQQSADQLKRRAQHSAEQQKCRATWAQSSKSGSTQVFCDSAIVFRCSAKIFFVQQLFFFVVSLFSHGFLCRFVDQPLFSLSFVAQPLVSLSFLCSAMVFFADSLFSQFSWASAMVVFVVASLSPFFWVSATLHPFKSPTDTHCTLLSHPLTFLYALLPTTVVTSRLCSRSVYAHTSTNFCNCGHIASMLTGKF